MTKISNTIAGTIDRFPEKGGWHFVRVPREQKGGLRKGRSWGFILIQATIGDYSWNTSLLPMGDGSYFIALNARVRKTCGVVLGDTVTIHYKPR